MREALKNAIAPGRTRAESNVDFAQAEPERSERQTLVDAVRNQAKRRCLFCPQNERLTVPFDHSDVLIIKREAALIKTLSGGRNHEQKHDSRLLAGLSNTMNIL
jgi:hypothetical protein